MKLLDSLYSIIDQVVTDAEHRYTIKLNPQHFIYAAHFPGEPITPGVCIMQIAQELLSEHTGQALAIKCVKNVKFLRIITPNENPVVSYSLQKISREDESIKAQVSVSSEEGVFAKLSLVCHICA
jgi:3-hydroxyacyl-[acyl-carrier-protein] dehydratase